MKISSLLLPLCSALLLAACNAPAPKVAHVETKTVSASLDFLPRHIHLLPEQRHNLDTELANVPPAAVTYIALTADISNPYSRRRVEWLENQLVQQGYSRDAFHNAGSHKISNDVSLVLQYAVSVPPHRCPDWSKNAVANYNNTDFSNFGCAYSNDMAMQLASPADMERGHGTPVYDATRESTVLQKYMSGPAASAGGASAGASSSSSAPAASGTSQ